MHFADFLAGSVGGACGVAVGYPLDTVKVRIQTQKQFTGIWQCIVMTLKKEGVQGFFKGMALPVTTISMTSSVVFGTYRNCLQCLARLRGTGAHNSKLDIFLSGMAGGVAQISVMSPGDLVKVRLQCQTESRRGGLSHDWTVVLLSGGVAGMAGWSVGTPMDVIKARLQMDRRYRGLVHCITETLRNEGPGVFFRSLGINCLRAFPVNMVVFAVYEVSVRVLRTPSLDRLS
ncbi:solute carrier family 25 member 47-A isoform X2 [Pimephales promelas]|uniref:solute carrier family 25 member 47-A isoform X2 n=1 Tax=Pimephales promelas TaxID=90988 RepID=UPI001955EF77|nr:solute carrier family 25 member 47-A isoform X2 [Pimephales promelas]